MNVYLEVSAANGKAWREFLPKLHFYAEEADVRLDAGTPLGDEPMLAPEGARLKCPQSNALRLHDIIQKAGLGDAVKLQVRLILPQHDPAEAEIQAKLYRDGSKPREPADRTPPSDSLRYEMTAEQYSEYMRGTGIRAKTDAG